MSAPICFIDTETDGVHPKRHPWEIAIIRVEDGKPDVEWSTFVDIDLSTADPSGLAIGRFYERHPHGRVLSGLDPAIPRPSFESVTNPWGAAEQVARLTHGAHIVGAVPNFDTEVLARLLRRWELIPAWHYHLVDVETLAVGFLAAHGRHLLPPWNSDDLTAALDLVPVPDSDRHTALGDARWARRIYEAVTSTAPRTRQVGPFPAAEVRDVFLEHERRIRADEPPLTTIAVAEVGSRLGWDRVSGQ